MNDAAATPHEDGDRDLTDRQLVQCVLAELDQVHSSNNRMETALTQISDAVDLLKADMLAQKTQVDAAVTFIGGACRA